MENSPAKLEVDRRVAPQQSRRRTSSSFGSVCWNVLYGVRIYLVRSWNMYDTELKYMLWSIVGGGGVVESCTEGVRKRKMGGPQPIY